MNFICHLKTQSVLNDDEIKEAFLYLDGIDGVIRDQFFIFAHENLGWAIGEKLTLSELVVFLNRNRDLLRQDAGNRYYFVQASLDKKVPLKVN